MKARKRIKRIGIILIVVAVLALIVWGVWTWFMRRAYPQTSGTINVSGLSRPVEILRDEFGVQDDADFMGRSTLELATRQASKAHGHKVNFAAVFLEQMTARRQFMLCAQILKHLDADTPIRFLIAECEAPARRPFSFPSR